MEPIVKKGLVDAVAEDLRGRVESGAMKGVLPGVRLLSEDLGVSVPTICRALHQLEAEGVLAGGKRRRWRGGDAGKRAESGIQSTEPPDARGAAFGTLVVSVRPTAEQRAPRGVEVFAELLDQLGNNGWEVMHRVENFAATIQPSKSWEKLFKLAQPGRDGGAWQALRRLAAGCGTSGIRSMFIGGDPGEQRLTGRGGPDRHDAAIMRWSDCWHWATGGSCCRCAAGHAGSGTPHSSESADESAATDEEAT